MVIMKGERRVSLEEVKLGRGYGRNQEKMEERGSREQHLLILRRGSQVGGGWGKGVCGGLRQRRRR